jgi:hypothetical protein
MLKCLEQCSLVGAVDSQTVVSMFNLDQVGLQHEIIQEVLRGNPDTAVDLNHRWEEDPGKKIDMLRGLGVTLVTLTHSGLRPEGPMGDTLNLFMEKCTAIGIDPHQGALQVMEALAQARSQTDTVVDTYLLSLHRLICTQRMNPKNPTVQQGRQVELKQGRRKFTGNWGEGVDNTPPAGGVYDHTLAHMGFSRAEVVEHGQ